MVKPHAAGSLNDRFENHGGEPVVLPLDQLAHRSEAALVPLVAETDLGSRREMLEGQPSGKDRVHAGHGVADRHGVPCVAVIAATDRRQRVFCGRPLRVHVLQSHLNGHFDGYRA